MANPSTRGKGSSEFKTPSNNKVYAKHQARFETLPENLLRKEYQLGTLYSLNNINPELTESLDLVNEQFIILELEAGSMRTYIVEVRITRYGSRVFQELMPECATIVNYWQAIWHIIIFTLNMQREMTADNVSYVYECAC